jgi:hypothetical protein
MAQPTTRTAAATARADRLFVSALAAAILATVFTGFAPSFYLRAWSASAMPLPTLLWIHGIAFSAWIALLALQVALVRMRRMSWHRILGAASLALAPLMGGTALMAQAARTRRALLDGSYAQNPMLENMLLALAFCAVPVFLALVALALLHRRRPEVHKRLMLIATVAIIGPALVRIPAVAAQHPVVGALLPFLYLLPLFAWDLWSRRRVLPVTAWGAGALVASQPLAMLLAGAPATALARWLGG